MTEEKEPKEERKEESSSGREEPEESGEKNPDSSPDQEESEQQERGSGSEPEEEEVVSSSSEGKPGDRQKKSSSDQEEPEEIPTPEPEPLLRHLASNLRLLISGILVCTVIYTAVLLLVGKVFWQDRSEGSLVHLDGKPVGAELIGQSFTSAHFFHPRPSSKGYDGMNSGSQNLGPYNEVLTDRVRARLKELEDEGVISETVPVDWVTESGSGLDPHITPAAALVQLPRVSRASGLPQKELEKLIDEHTEGKLLGLFGQERVNVLLLNMNIQKRLGGSK